MPDGLKMIFFIYQYKSEKKFTLFCSLFLDVDNAIK